MKLKESITKDNAMNKELYNRFLEIIQFEYNKMSFLKGAKFYCWAHGLQSHCNFFKIMKDCCSKCLNDLIYHLLSRFEEVPEFKIKNIRTEYDSIEDLFTAFAKNEDEYVGLLEEATKIAKNVDDIEALALFLPMVKNIDHIACRALEAVKNNKNPYELLTGYCEDYVSR